MVRPAGAMVCLPDEDTGGVVARPRARLDIGTVPMLGLRLLDVPASLLSDPAVVPAGPCPGVDVDVAGAGLHRGLRDRSVTGVTGFPRAGPLLPVVIETAVGGRCDVCGLEAAAWSDSGARPCEPYFDR